MAASAIVAGTAEVIAAAQTCALPTGAGAAAPAATSSRITHDLGHTDVGSSLVGVDAAFLARLVTSKFTQYLVGIKFYKILHSTYLGTVKFDDTHILWFVAIRSRRVRVYIHNATTTSVQYAVLSY